MGERRAVLAGYFRLSLLAWHSELRSLQFREVC
jgi:hypothetical protein